MFDCYTNEIEFVTSNISITIDGVATTDSFIASDVLYSQTVLSTVTSLTTTENTVTFTGTGFPIADYSPQAKIGGVFADSVTINSATEVTASWTATGLPGITDTP
jgi:hypothetical protein